MAASHSLDNCQDFLASCDRKLKDPNTHYKIFRQDPIPPPRLRILTPGSFAILRQRQLQQGIPDSQVKFPYISENRQFFASLTV